MTSCTRVKMAHNF